MANKTTITVIRSSRRSLSLEIRPDLSVIVRAPYRASRREIEQFVADKEDWLTRHLSKMAAAEAQRAQIPKLSKAQLEALADKALQDIPPRAAYFADRIGVRYGRITIRHQHTRWGSCSARGNLNFNCLIMLMPQEIIDYVIVHELCHLIEMNHSPAFWARVAAVLPDYQTRVRWLKTHGSEIMARNP